MNGALVKKGKGKKGGKAKGEKRKEKYNKNMTQYALNT